MVEKKYGLCTAIAMIVGIVIGSGIFFKSDDILIATGGNVFLGVVVFSLAAISIIFGSLTIAELAARSNGAGGVISYAEEFCNKKAACVFGWFQFFLYYPTLVAVVAWVTGIYTCILFGIDGTLKTQILIGTFVIVVLYAVNVLSARLGGYFQNLATIIKLLPLIIFAFAGIFFSDLEGFTPENMQIFASTGWIAAVAPIAFSFDGWVVATSISHEIKDAKRNLPLALILGPLFILAIYIIYFVGICAIVGPDQVMALGDEHVTIAANQLFGPTGAKIITTFVIISVLGTVNGLILGNIRLPYALALKKMLPGSDKLKLVHPKYDIPMYSAATSFVLVMIWMVAHYLTQKHGLLPNSDISEISIVMSYTLYILLYVQVIRLGLKGIVPGVFKGKITPVLAIFGSLFIFYGGSQNPLFWYYFAFCLFIIGASLVYAKKKGY